jgi:hypothetical protein
VRCDKCSLPHIVFSSCAFSLAQCSRSMSVPLTVCAVVFQCRTAPSDVCCGVALISSHCPHEASATLDLTFVSLPLSAKD